MLIVPNKNQVYIVSLYESGKTSISIYTVQFIK